MAIGASRGKDSTVLVYLMKTLNERHDYGLDLFFLSIDEGITTEMTPWRETKISIWLATESGLL